jgi:hypothetical protein
MRALANLRLSESFRVLPTMTAMLRGIELSFVGCEARAKREAV